MRYIAYTIFSALLLSPQAYGDKPTHETQTISYFQTGARYHYVIDLLQLILEETTDTFGPYQLQPLKDINYRRGAALLAHGKQVDIMVSAPNKAMIEQLQPILTPIEQGLLGYRVFFIHRDNTTKFSEVANLAQLKQHFVAGFGAGWIDRKILEANHIPLITHSQYPLLFKMLIGKRFDYFPRGINEIDPEFRNFAADFPELKIEETLAFYYPYPRYFFISKDNRRLKKRLEAGFSIIQKNGRFQALFEQRYRHTLQRIKREKRRIFVLHNPLLPSGVPLPDTRNWLPADQLVKGNTVH